MKPKILIIGSTGKLGIKLSNFCFKNKISIHTATCHTNSKKLIYLNKKNKFSEIFTLNISEQKKSFLNLLKTTNFKLIYFLDYGSNSLEYLNLIIKYNSHSYIAIANKEMIIAGGKLLIESIRKSKNYFIPLDSEHFSLKNNIINNNNIKKLYITASGGPFYFSKFNNFKNVKLNKVLSHPRWKMGKNNLIDSSNFMNKILEIYELSYIYDISLDKIDFLISKSAFVHSVIEYEDGIVSLNAFKNNMLLTLIHPLRYFFDINTNIKSNSLLMKNANFNLQNNFDHRFNFFKYYKTMKSFTHIQQINLLLLNNYAQSLYLSNKIKYVDIIPFIFKSLNRYPNKCNFSSLLNIVNYIKKFKYNV